MVLFPNRITEYLPATGDGCRHHPNVLPVFKRKRGLDLRDAWLGLLEDGPSDLDLIVMCGFRDSSYRTELQRLGKEAATILFNRLKKHGYLQIPPMG